jgi:dTDP-4-dehydrorhamnose reductase
MRILVAGRTGQVAQALAAAPPPGASVVALGRPDLDLARPETIAAVVERMAPDAIVNAAAYTAVDRAEAEPDLAMTINRDGAAALARAARGLPFIHLSTDYVFDGTKGTPYDEDDATAPVNAYGRSKREGEQAVTAANPDALTLRIAWVFSAWGTNLATSMLKRAADGGPLRVVADQLSTPTHAADLAAAIWDLLARPAMPRGVFHLAGPDGMSRYDFVLRLLAQRRGPPVPVTPVAAADFPAAARRPQDTRLDSRRLGITLPPIDAAIADCLATLKLR